MNIITRNGNGIVRRHAIEYGKHRVRKGLHVHYPRAGITVGTFLKDLW